jgi:hypothetical protein
VVVFPSRSGVEREHSIAFAGGKPAQLAGAGLYLSLYFGIIVGEGAPSRGVDEVTTIEYSYRLLDHHQRELVAYHYHPSGVSWCTYPHLHVAAASDVFSGKAHLATGWVSLPAVVRMLIEDPAIPVVSLRPDWSWVLDAALAPDPS